MVVDKQHDPDVAPVTADTVLHMVHESTDHRAGGSPSREQAILRYVQEDKPAVRGDQASIASGSPSTCAQRLAGQHDGRYRRPSRASFVRSAKNARFDNRFLRDAIRHRYICHFTNRNTVKKPGYAQ